jgi:hypothetical protein
MSVTFISQKPAWNKGFLNCHFLRVPLGVPATVEATLNDPLSLSDLLPSGQDGRRPSLWK